MEKYGNYSIISNVYSGNTRTKYESTRAHSLLANIVATRDFMRASIVNKHGGFPLSRPALRAIPRDASQFNAHRRWDTAF